jgi:hypothetical protein
MTLDKKNIPKPFFFDAFLPETTGGKDEFEIL